MKHEYDFDWASFHDTYFEIPQDEPDEEEYEPDPDAAWKMQREEPDLYYGD